MIYQKIRECFPRLINNAKQYIYTYAQSSFENIAQFCRKIKDGLKKYISIRQNNFVSTRGSISSTTK
ncbi:MAG: hypothetical protein ACI4T2_04100 [Christensenellales bacterium]